MDTSANRTEQTAGAGCKPGLIVMAKTPRAGQVKTRLCPPLSPEAAASLAACCVRDAVAAALSLNHPVCIAYAPDDGRDALESILPANLHWSPQRGENLGDRMHAAMEDAAKRGFRPLIVIGT